MKRNVAAINVYILAFSYVHKTIRFHIIDSILS